MPSPSPREVSSHVRRRPWTLGLALLCIGHVVLVLSRAYVTGGDWAFIELRTRDVFSGDTPLTGAWSRYGWNHPGPLLYDLLAIPYRLTGSSWRGLWLGALVLNVVALVVAVRLLEPNRSERADDSDPADPGVGSAVDPVDPADPVDEASLALVDRADPADPADPTSPDDPDGATRPVVGVRDGTATSGVAGWLTAWAIALAGMWTFAAGTAHLATDPWNASVVVVPVLTMVAAAAAVLVDDRRGVAVAAVVFVAAAQTHAAYGVLLLPLVLVALGVGLVRWRRYTLMWIGIGAVLMLPALVDTLVNWPGNFYRSIRFTLTASEPAVGFAQAARVIGRATSLSFFGEARLPSFVAVVRDPPWGLLPFAGLVALAVARRVAVVRGWTVHRRSLEATALLWLGGVLMVARTRGPLLIWLTTWMVVAAAVTWCLVGAVVVRWLLERRSETTPSDPSRVRFVGTAAVGAVALLLATVNIAGSVGEGYPFQEVTQVVQQFADDAEPYAASPIAIDLAGDEYVAGAVQSGLIVELEARGLQPRGRPDQRLQLGTHRTDLPLAPPSLLVRVEAQSGAPEDASVVSVSDPLNATERAEADALMTELGALLDSAGVGDRRELLVNDLAPLAAFRAPPEVAAELDRFERLGELHGRGQRIVLYLIGA